MDPITHTISGVALGNTGLEKKTRFGRAAFVLAAVAPDVDFVFTFWDSTLALEYRRGLTHGIIGLIVLPWIIAGLMLTLDKLNPKKKIKAKLGPLLAFSYIGVVLHSLFDYLNTYGVRWLFPFSGEWFYIDTLFIFDVYLFLILLIALLWPKKQRTKAVIISIAIAVLYAFTNLGISRYAKHLALQEMPTPTSSMTAPVALTPLERDIVFEYPDHYLTAKFSLTGSPKLVISDQKIIKNLDQLDLSQLSNKKEVEVFLNWARFPFLAEQDGEKFILDARYVRSLDRNFGFALVKLKF